MAQAIRSGAVKTDTVLSELEQLRAENAALKAAAEAAADAAARKAATSLSVELYPLGQSRTVKDDKGVTKAVENKGNLVIRGMGRFPISLYSAQAPKLFGGVSLLPKTPSLLRDIATLIVDHADKMAWKDSAPTAKADTVAWAKQLLAE
jgi:hypothetical protein